MKIWKRLLKQGLMDKRKEGAYFVRWEIGFIYKRICGYFQKVLQENTYFSVSRSGYPIL